MDVIGVVSHTVQLYSAFDRADLQPANMYLGAVGMEQRNARERRGHSFDTRSTPSCTVVARSFPVTISLRKRMQREIRRTCERVKTHQWSHHHVKAVRHAPDPAAYDGAACSHKRRIGLAQHGVACIKRPTMDVDGVV